MRSIKMLGLAIVAVLAFAAVGAAGASAHEFNSTKAGALEVVKNGNQVFTTNENSVTCTTDSVVKGEVAEGKTEEVKAEIGYSGCSVEAFGLKFSATVSNAAYDFNANEFANLENTVTISVPIAGCEITIAPQSNLKTVSYSGSGNVTVSAAVSGIEWSGTGGECGLGGTNGVYEGVTEVGVSGSTLSWS